MLNHNKRSLTVNTKKKGGMQVLDRLIKSCDVMVENFAPGALDRNRYDRMARFLAERRLIRSVPALDSYAVELPPAAR
jgi:crotonobetainyl-CoA:carnitine CoA-transferase CaiB-like acyl-CoA transferase